VSDAVIIGPGDGETITERDARTVEILQGHELIDVTWSRYEAGERGPDPHVHREHVDSFYVVEGTLVFELGGAQELRVEAGPGTFVAATQNVVHTFRNESDARATFLNFHTPSGGFAANLRGVRDGRDVPWDSFDPPAGGGRAAAEAVVSLPGTGEQLDRGDRMLAIKAELVEISVIELVCEPGWDGIAPHRHDDHVDTFVVLDGDAELLRESGSARCGPGSFLAAVPGAVHGIGPAAQRLRLLNVHAPDAGFARTLR
jgi:quercetin dioxygenase-like cupin family protein